MLGRANVESSLVASVQSLMKTAQHRKNCPRLLRAVKCTCGVSLTLSEAHAILAAIDRACSVLDKRGEA
jgi:hypothetical protein